MSQHGGADDVGDVRIATKLLAVAEDGDGVATQYTFDEDVVAHVGALPGPVDGEVAEDGGGKTELAVIRPHEMLGGELGDAVWRDGLWTGRLRSSDVAAVDAGRAGVDELPDGARLYGCLHEALYGYDITGLVEFEVSPDGKRPAHRDQVEDRVDSLEHRAEIGHAHI